MKNNKKMILLSIIIAVFILVLVGTIFGLKLRIKDGGLYIGKSVLTPYAYTFHKDGIVLEKYHGNEEEIAIPSEILGKPVKVIGYQCFEANDGVKKVKLSENIDKIDSSAFSGCDNLQEITQGKYVTVIGSYAFSSCDKLIEVNMGNQIEEIQNGAFARCTNLKKMIPQENLKYIGERAFLDSTLEEFEFSKDVEIGTLAFDGTSWIQNQPEEFVVYGDGNLIGYNGMDKKVVIPKGIKILNGGCFAGSVEKEIYVSETVQNIKEFAFYDCNNTSIYIPASVIQMGDKYSIANSDDNITIITTEGSNAHQHAKEHDIPYELVEEW